MYAPFGVVSNYIVFLFLFSSIKAGIPRPAVGAGKGKIKLHDLLMCGFCSVANGEIVVVRTENLELHITIRNINQCWNKTFTLKKKKEYRMLINTFHLFILPEFLGNSLALLQQSLIISEHLTDVSHCHKYSGSRCTSTDELE